MNWYKIAQEYKMSDKIPDDLLAPVEYGGALFKIDADGAHKDVRIALNYNLMSIVSAEVINPKEFAYEFFSMAWPKTNMSFNTWYEKMKNTFRDASGHIGDIEELSFEGGGIRVAVRNPDLTDGDELRDLLAGAVITDENEFIENLSEVTAREVMDYTIL